MSLLYGSIDGNDDLLNNELNMYYNAIGQQFLNQIIAECNVFSFKKILKQETINSIRKYIYNYNKHLYRTIEEYNTAIENIEQRVQEQIDNIEYTMYEITDDFEKNILDEIFEYSVQYHEMFEFFRDIIHNKISYKLQNDRIQNDNESLFAHISNNFYRNQEEQLTELPNLDDFEEEKEDPIFEKSNLKNYLNNFIELDKVLLYDNKFILKEVFVEYIFTHFYDFIQCTKYDILDNRQVYYLFLHHYISLYEKIDETISYSHFKFIYKQLKKLNVGKSNVIYTKLLTILENQNIEESKDINIDFNYFIVNLKLTFNLFDQLCEENKINEDLIRSTFNLDYYIKNFPDNLIIKYKDFINISSLLEKRECSNSLIENLCDDFTGFDWDYVFKNYKTLSDNFLLEHSDRLLIYIYKRISRDN